MLMPYIRYQSTCSSNSCRFCASDRIVLQHVAAHVVPVGFERLPGFRDGPHAHAVHPVPVDMLVEQLSFLRLGQPSAEPLGDMNGADEERGVSPVEDVGIQGVVAAALFVDALDVGV